MSGWDKRKKTVRWLISMMLTVALVCGALPAGAYAQAGAPAITKAQAGAPANANAQAGAPANAKAQTAYRYSKSDQIIYQDAYFQQSSYKDNLHLARLSAQAAQAAGCYFNYREDPKQQDPSQNAKNVIGLLEDIGFSDVKANQYYSTEKLENSIGVVIGRRVIRSGGKTFTLLAVVVRSINYRQEWAGNMEVGDGNIHSGHKAARDEALRFLRKYIEDNRITGDLKIWLTGHSRGAAVANLTGGFLAGGGSAYLGSAVRITPEDIYSYCFAVPSLIRKGMAKSEELSVTGARGGKYQCDTEGAPFVSTAKGTLDPKASIYRGIKAFTQDEDIIVKMPPVQWGLTFYGTGQRINGDATWNEMMTQLKTVEPGRYEEFARGGDPAGFAYYTLDLPSLQIVKDKSRPQGSMKSFFTGRVDALNELIPSGAYYVSSGYQDALAAAGAIVGMLLTANAAYNFAQHGIDKSDLIRPMMLTYLAYATQTITEKYAKAGASLSEAQALGIWLEECGEYISGLKAPEDPTADFIVLSVCEFIAANPDSEAVHKILGYLSTDLSQSDRDLLCTLLPPEEWSKATNEDLVKNALIACARGPVKGCVAGAFLSNAASVRKYVYGPLNSTLKDYPELVAAIDDGKGNLTDVSAAIIKILCARTDGSEATAYQGLGEAADAELVELLGPVLRSGAARAGQLYQDEYPGFYADAMRHVDTALANMSQLRHILTCVLLTTPGRDSSIETSLSNACTFVSNLSMIAPGHYCEGYVSWISARIAKHQETETVPAPAKKKAQNLKVTVKKKTVKRSALKKKKKTVSAIIATGAKTAVTYRKVSGSARLSVNASSGRITIRKGTKKGTYRIAVAVAAPGTAQFLPAQKTVTIRIKVK